MGPTAVRGLEPPLVLLLDLSLRMAKISSCSLFSVESSSRIIHKVMNGSNGLDTAVFGPHHELATGDHSHRMPRMLHWLSSHGWPLGICVACGGRR